MAVYTSYDLKPQYYTGAVSGCINGGEDYRTVGNKEGIQDVNLMVNPQMSGLSNACTITNFKMSCQYRVTNTSNGSGLTLRGGFYWYPSLVENPTISGTSLTMGSNNLDPAGNVTFLADSILTINSERRGDTKYSSFSQEVQPSIGNLNGKNVLIGAHFAFQSLNSAVSCRMWLKNVTFTITRTRACYITFTNLTPGKGDSYTQQFDYGTVPEFKNVTANGYIFKGWKASNGTIYTTLPAAGEVDVTYTAVWELDKTYVLYDSIFSFKRWKDTNLASNSFISVSDVTDIGFKGTALVDDAYTDECRPLIPVTNGKTYTFECDTSGGSFEFFIFNCNSSGSWSNFTYGNTKKFNFTASTDYVSIRCDVVGTGTVVNFSNFRIYPADCPYMSNSVSSAERTDKDSWSMPTPIREGYKFKGWNTKPDGTGTVYTSSSVFPTSDLILYSQWELDKINKIYVGTSQPKEIYVGT